MRKPCEFADEKSGGQIIIVSSVTGMNGAAQETAYTGTKFANQWMAQFLNREFRRKFY